MPHNKVTTIKASLRWANLHYFFFHKSNRGMRSLLLFSSSLWPNMLIWICYSRFNLKLSWNPPCQCQYLNYRWQVLFSLSGMITFFYPCFVSCMLFLFLFSFFFFRSTHMNISKWIMCYLIFVFLSQYPTSRINETCFMKLFSFWTPIWNSYFIHFYV